jgi:uncharacterized protein (DUF433 family)
LFLAYGGFGKGGSGYNDPSETPMAKQPKVIHSDPEILDGTPVFVGTRVPVQNLIDCLEAGDSLDEFLDSFPTVTREQAVAALEIAREALEESAHSSR